MGVDVDVGSCDGNYGAGGKPAEGGRRCRCRRDDPVDSSVIPRVDTGVGPAVGL